MADVNVTVVGYVGTDPVLKTANSGLAWTQFRVGSTRRWRDTESGQWVDGPTMWFTVKTWDSRAHNVVDSIRKGTPVVVTGRLSEEPYVFTRPDENGEPISERRQNLSIENAVVAVDVSRGIVRYHRVDRNAAEPADVPHYLRNANPDASGGNQSELGDDSGNGADSGISDDSDDRVGELVGAAAF